MRFIVDVLALKLVEGALAVYRPIGDEEWYYLGEDLTWRVAEGRPARFALPTVELARSGIEFVVRAMTRFIATIVNLQEHSGTVVIFVREFRTIKEPDGTEYAGFIGSILMTTSKDLTRLPVSLSANIIEGFTPSRLEIDKSTIETIDLMDTVDEVHSL